MPNNIELVVRLAPEEYFFKLQEYKSKFKLYDKKLYEALLLEEKNRNNSQNVFNKEDKINYIDVINRNICPDILKKRFSKFYTNNKLLSNKIAKIINDFNKQYITDMNNYIELIHEEADKAYLAKENIKPKGIGLVHLLYIRGISIDIFSLNEEMKEKNAQKQRVKIDKSRDFQIQKYHDELLTNILSNYENLKKELLEYLDYK